MGSEVVSTNVTGGSGASTARAKRFKARNFF